MAERAAWHFGRLGQALGGLRERLLAVENAMETLAREYRARFAPCRLVLFVKRRPDRRPTGLHWGRTFKLPGPDGPHGVRKHLGGRLTGRRIFAIALRWRERDVFFDFDRRRLVLNRDHARLARALVRSARSLIRLTADSDIIYPAPPSAAPAWPKVEAAWRAAWGCAALETKMIEFVRRSRTSPLFPYAGVGSDGYVHLGWALPDQYVRDDRVRRGHRHVASRLTREHLRALGLPRSAWGALRAIDREMRAFRRLHAEFAGTFGRVRKIAWNAGASEGRARA